jgi:hypothetical protein
MGFKPATSADLNRIDLGKIDAEISRCHDDNKNLPGNREAQISFRDILPTRTESGDGQSSPQAPESGKDKPPLTLSEKGLAAIEIILAVIGNGLKEPREFLAQFAERDLIDWAFPESVLRTRQILRSFSPTTSLRKTIEVVDTERLTALNVHDISAWKSNMGGAEQFYFRGPTRLLFTLSIESPINVLSELSERDRARFLDIDEAIRRYSREHGHLVNEPDPEVGLEQPRDIDFSFDDALPRNGYIFALSAFLVAVSLSKKSTNMASGPRDPRLCPRRRNFPAKGLQAPIGTSRASIILDGTNRYRALSGGIG